MMPVCMCVCEQTSSNSMAAKFTVNYTQKVRKNADFNRMTQNKNTPDVPFIITCLSGCCLQRGFTLKVCACFAFSY